MPNCVGAWIRINDTIVRRLQGDELYYRGLVGNTKHLKTIVSTTARALEHTTSLAIWESLMEALAGVRRVARAAQSLRTRWHETSANLSTSPLNAATTFLWTPKWYNQRVHNLHLAAQHYQGREARLIHEGLESLAVHRNNYDATGAVLKKLQLLWWEFPPEQWGCLARL